jgi:hypothetical protein
LRLPRVRLTVRRMMVAVALIALPLAALGEIQRRRAAYLRVADSHYSRLTNDTNRLGRGIGPYFISPVTTGNPREDRLITYRVQMIDKYVDAARRPWLPVPPDPPEPE